MTLKITKCTVIHRRNSADMIVLDTNLPSPCPGFSDEAAQLSLLHVQVDTGEAYCRDNFPGVPVEVLNT